MRRLIAAAALVGAMSAVPLAAGPARTNEGHQVHLVRAVATLPAGWEWVTR